MKIDVEATDEFRAGTVLYQRRPRKHEYRSLGVDGCAGPWVMESVGSWTTKLIPHDHALAILRAIGLEVEVAPEPVRVTHAVRCVSLNLIAWFGSEKACKEYAMRVPDYEVVPCPFAVGKAGEKGTA